jgi:L-alanine-DL-glutamate epimerase-like enolase superfamily enzyme
MSQYFKIGKLAASFGLKGELVLQHSLGNKTALKGLETIFIEQGKDNFMPYFISSTNIKNDKEIFVKLEEVDTMETARKLTPKEVWITEEDFKKFAAKASPIAMLGFHLINEEEDLARIATVRKLNPQAKIRIDVNGLWSVDQASKFLESCGEIEYVEQPCASVEELRELKSRIDVKIVGDEILRKSTNPFEVDLQGAIDIVMLKVQPLGGIKKAHALATHHKLPVVVSSALESAIGINYGLTLAASFEEMSFDCGLATGSLLASNVAELPIVDGKMQITRLEPNFDGLEVSADRFEWWKNRIMRTAALLG